MSKQVNQYVVTKQSGILLNANESTENLSQQIQNEIGKEVYKIAYNRYPDNRQEELLEAYSKIAEVNPKQLLAGNGSDQMLGLLISKYLGKGKTLYTFSPDFSMYDYYASSYEADILKFPLEQDGSLDIDAFIKYGNEKNVDLVMFSNPNNPTGHCLNIAEIEKIVSSFKNQVVVVDEAYYEFSDEVSAITLLNQYPNLYVTRTLSKAYCLAGMRVGFMISNVANIDAMKEIAVPYALNSGSMKVATIVLKHVNEFKEKFEKTKQERDTFYQKVKGLKAIRFVKSQTNFLYGYCLQQDELVGLFAKKNIVIRNYEGKKAIRITIGSEEENAMVLSVLEEFERSQTCA